MRLIIRPADITDESVSLLSLNGNPVNFYKHRDKQFVHRLYG